MSTQTPWWQGPRGEGYVIIQLVLFILVGFGPKQIPGVLPLWSPPWSVWALAIGLALLMFGGTLATLGLLSLGPNLTPFPRPRQDNALVDTGAYNIVRHPIYSGILMAGVAWACFSASTLTLIYTLILFLFFDIKSRQEEQWLAEKHPDYPAYQKRVKKLIPFIY